MKNVISNIILNDCTTQAFQRLQYITFIILKIINISRITLKISFKNQNHLKDKCTLRENLR